MTAAALLADLAAAGHRVALRQDGRISIRPAPAEVVLARVRQHRDDLAQLLAEAAAEASPERAAEPWPALSHGPFTALATPEAVAVQAHYERVQQSRPPAWATIADPPSERAFCSCCRSRRWWCEAVEPRGWRCSTCRPPLHLPAEQRCEVAT